MARLDAMGATDPRASEPSPRDVPRAGRILAAAALLAVMWFALLGHRDLLHPDEGRYAEIPREMVASGDWITPHLDGLKYFEKPPLQYWATGAAFGLLGAGNATARLWPASLGFLGILWVFLLGRRLFGPLAAVYAALILASGLLWVAMGHLLTLDMGLSVFLALAIGALLWAQSERGDPVRERRWMLLAWGALAAATLSKGPVAVVLAAGTVVLYSLWQRDLALWRHLHLGRGLLLFLALAAPWFVAVGLRNPGFTEFFFLHEHFARFATDVAGRVHPWWTFVPVVLLGSAPWVGSATLALVRPGFAWRSGSGGFDPVRFVWVHVVFTVVFFSASHSKLVPYVLPVFPALALLAGRRLALRPRFSWDALAAVALGLLIFGTTLAPGLVASLDLPRSLLLGYRPYILSASGLLIAAGAIGLRLRAAGLRSAALLSASSLLAFQLLLWGFQVLAPVHSSRCLADAIRSCTGDDVPVYSVNRYDQPLPFYLRRTVELVSERGELDYGLREEPDKAIPDLDTFRKIWSGKEQGVAVMSSDLYRALLESGLPMRLLHEDPRRVAVLRR
jgi:4-amino-4-deoxy-L-arabinose transferase-like glycosyltransferase